MPAVRRSWNASSGWACRFWYVDARLAELSCGWGACDVELMTAAQLSRPAPRHLEWDLTDEVTGRTARRGERRCLDILPALKGRGFQLRDPEGSVLRFTVHRPGHRRASPRSPGVSRRDVA